MTLRSSCLTLAVVMLAVAAAKQFHQYGYYVDNGTHYLLYNASQLDYVWPAQQLELELEQEEPWPHKHRPYSALGNISSNPNINALQQLEALPTRIVGGRRISCARAPYQVSVHLDNNFICGGVILSRRWILTAAHCIAGKAARYSVRVGSAQQNNNGQRREVQLIVVNSKFNKRTMRNDLALMKLKRSLRFGRCAHRVHLPKSEYYPPCFLVSGWGLTSQNAPDVQQHLRAAKVCLVHRHKCDLSYAKIGIPIYDEMICASAKGKDSCSGDSGGPLVHNMVLYGVVSFGTGCANIHYPGVYVNAARYTSWILRVTQLY